MTTIKIALGKIAARLAPSTDESSTESRLLLARVLKIPPSELISHHDDFLTIEQSQQLEQLINQRLTGKPIQYVLKEAWFYTYPFYVDERVLIPRQETEYLITKALEWIKNFSQPTTDNPQPLTIADIGTGSGNIAITMALEISKLTAYNLQLTTDIYATDISPAALAVARLNANNLLSPISSVLNPISFLPGSLLHPLPQPANLILANLPYIPSARIPHLQAEVSDYEPHVALDGGKDGFQLYRRLFSQLKSKWKSPGLFLSEIDYTHRYLATGLFKQYLPESSVEVIVDPVLKQPFLQATI